MSVDTDRSAVSVGVYAAELSVIQPLLALLIVFGLLFLVAWLLRKGRLLPAGSQNMLKLVGSLPLGSKAYIAVIEIGQQCLVVGVTPQQMTLLHTLPKESLPVNQAVIHDHSFKSWFETAIQRFNQQ